MKVRNGFVSNSSSSSFVMALSKKPKNANDLISDLFGSETSYPNPHVWGDSPVSFPAIDVCERLLRNLNFSMKEIRKSLIEDYYHDIAWSVRDVGESRAKGDSSCWLADDSTGGFIPSNVYAQRKINEHIAALKKFYPRTKWEEKIESAIVRKMKWEVAHVKASKNKNEVEASIRKEKNIPQWKWQDTAKMSRETKLNYEKEYKRYNHRFETEILKDPRFVEADKVLQKLYSRDFRHDSTIELIAKSLSDIFFKENEGRKFAIVEIHDDSEMGSAMEHGTLFNKIPHLRFSHH